MGLWRVLWQGNVGLMVHIEGFEVGSEGFMQGALGFWQCSSADGCMIWLSAAAL